MQLLLPFDGLEAEPTCQFRIIGPRLDLEFPTREALEQFVRDLHPRGTHVTVSEHLDYDPTTKVAVYSYWIGHRKYPESSEAPRGNKAAPDD